MTRSAPSSVTSATFAALVTPVTVAPRCLASWTAIVPTAPEAPLTSTLVPGPTVALSRRKNSAVVAPNNNPAASSSLTPNGLRAIRFAGVARYWACAPMARPVMPHTSSPGSKPCTPAPMASTSPENELPRIVRRGPKTPNASRASTPNPGGNRAPRMRESPEVMAAAFTRTRTSSGRGVGRATSAICATSGGPYLVTTAACMALLHVGQISRSDNSVGRSAGRSPSRGAPVGGGEPPRRLPRSVPAEPHP